MLRCCRATKNCQLAARVAVASTGKYNQYNRSDPFDWTAI